VVILESLDNLFVITATPSKRWVNGSSNVGGLVLGALITAVLLLTVAGVVVVGSSSSSDEAGYESAGKAPARSAQSPGGAQPTSAPTKLPEREPAASIAIQAITQLAATVRLQSRAASEQVDEVTVGFVSEGQLVATGSRIARLNPREEAHVDV
jgi:hypothetical protein